MKRWETEDQVIEAKESALESTLFVKSLSFVESSVLFLRVGGPGLPASGYRRQLHVLGEFKGELGFRRQLFLLARQDLSACAARAAQHRADGCAFASAQQSAQNRADRRAAAHINAGALICAQSAGSAAASLSRRLDQK